MYLEGMTDWKPEEGRPGWLPDVDLVGVTRGRLREDPSRGAVYRQVVETWVSVEVGGRYYRWIRCGLLTDVGEVRGVVRVQHIGARYEWATDGEHDSAYAFRLQVVGFHLEYISGGVQEFVGMLPGGRGSRDSFQVPGASQRGLADIPGGHWCGDGGCSVESGRHIITRFTPEPIAEELWERLRGQVIRVSIAPVDAIS